jgi:hypothetical protein
MWCLRNQKRNKAVGDCDVRYASACRYVDKLKFIRHSDGHGLELRLQHFNHAAHVDWIFFLDQ